MKPLTLISIALFWALGDAVAQEAAHDAADPSILASACNGCHGVAQADADAPPVLAGMDAPTFMRRMIDFKSGACKSSIMNRVARGYDEAELQKMANYFSRQRP